jgi:hypothetical protein
VIEEFRMYGPAAGTTHEVTLATINNNISGLLHPHRQLKAVKSAIAAGIRFSAARCHKKTL